MTYKQSLTNAMALLATDARTLFIGQSLRYSGQAMWPTYEHLPMERRIELPVIEEFQMGFCTGLALAGYVPVCIYTRWDFLILACNQLINHLDKIPLMGDFKPKVIIRVAVGTTEPLNTGPQHTQDYSEAFKLMLRTIPVIECRDEAAVEANYAAAHKGDGSVVLVEYMDQYRV